MGKVAKKDKSCGINLKIQVRDGINRIDEREFKLSSTTVKGLSFNVTKLKISEDSKKVIKARKEFIDFKDFLSKYS